MASRGDSWQHQDREAHQQLNRPRDDYPRPSYPSGPGPYPHVDPRERERPWSAVDPRYNHYPASPPPRPDVTHGSAPYYRPGYGQPHSQPFSRQGYDYSYWEYRDPYAYYDPHHRGQHYQHPDAGGRSSHDQWRTNPPSDRGHGQDWGGPPYQQYHSYDQRGESSQYDYSQSEGHYMRKSEECEPGVLASSKASGLSSSSTELSQYINGAEESDSIPQSYAEPEMVPQLTAPLKYTLPHALVSFGPAGQLIRVSSAIASDGERALVEFHSLEVILGESEEQKDLRNFPGPLARPDLHKVDVITFALQKAEGCLKDDTLQDAPSAALLWNLLVLLCRQNGRIVGSDIAELLTRGTVSLGACEGSDGQGDETSLIDLTDRPPPEEEPLHTGDLLTGNPTACPADSTEEALRSYTQLLLCGRKKEALESAMKSGLWGHALFLASKMDNRAYTTVLNRFTGCLSPSDPLQTLFQLLSKRIPTVATCCGSDRWGDWKPHLAVMLSNESEDCDTHRRAIITMGDTLASRGQLHAAHICYLTARTPFGVYTNKAERLVLLGSSHSLPFLKFVQSSAMQCTEVFEYSQRLGNPAHVDPPFQVYKFLYACRLLDCGLASQAYHYCEVVGKTLLTMQEPPTVLLKEVIKLTDRLKHGEDSLVDAGANSDLEEPDWLMELRAREIGAQMKHWVCNEPYQPAGEKNAVDPDESRVGSGVHTGTQLYGEGMWALTGAATATSLPDSLPVGAQGGWIPPVDGPPPTTGQLTQESPMLTGYGQMMVPSSTEPERQAESVAEPIPHCAADHQGPSLLPIQPGSSYPPPAEALHPPLSSPPADPQGLGISYGPAMVPLYTNGTTPGGGDLAKPTKFPTLPEPKTKDTASIQPGKSTKTGWFSGWFRSKAKDTERDDSDVGPPLAPLQEPTSSPTLSSGPLQTSVESSRTLNAPPLSTGVNPFSRRAAGGQPQSVYMTPNHGSMPQSA
ncbi:protein transport protein Sec16B [Sardina pilchardus]|uniref:protein transport protein Sec16B n=1 Tax=Sardina pilchardus TaxID=27697 RepID=UPI002E108714